MTSRHTKRLKRALAAKAQAKTAVQISQEFELEKNSVQEKLASAQASEKEALEKIEQEKSAIQERLASAQAAEKEVLEKYAIERKKLHDGLPFEAQGRADWHRWAPDKLRALDERREAASREAKNRVLYLKSELLGLDRRNREAIEANEARKREAAEAIEAINMQVVNEIGRGEREAQNARLRRKIRLEDSFSSLSRLDFNSHWSPHLQQVFEANREQILKSFPGTGARSTENWTFTATPTPHRDWEEPRFAARQAGRQERDDGLGQMPHLRTLSGLLLHLEAAYGKRVGGNVLRRFEILLKKNNVKTMLDAGSGATGPLLWLARTGIPKKLGIELFAIDVRTLEEPEQKRLERAGIRFISADANKALELIGKPIDIILSSAVLSPGGQAEFANQRKQTQEKRPRVDLPSASARSHLLAKNLVSALSANPAAALVATSWFGSLALRQKRAEKFARVRLWQTDSSAEESDRDRIYQDAGVPQIERHHTTAQGRAYRDAINKNWKKIRYGEALLTGAKLAVLQKK